MLSEASVHPAFIKIRCELVLEMPQRQTQMIAAAAISGPLVEPECHEGFRNRPNAKPCCSQENTYASR
jgi:hypothetical protein